MADITSSFFSLKLRKIILINIFFFSKGHKGKTKSKDKFQGDLVFLRSKIKKLDMV